MNRWDRELSDKTRIYPRRYSIPISLIIDRGRLMLRVRGMINGEKLEFLGI